MPRGWFVKPVLSHMLKHVPDRDVLGNMPRHMDKDVLKHMPDKHMLEHVPVYVSRNVLKQMAHAVLMT